MHHTLMIRSYEGQSDRTQVEDLERRCEVGPGERVFLFTDTMGDPYVAELDKELVGVIQGSIKVVRVHMHTKDLARVGYILGLRVAPLHRRKRDWVQSSASARGVVHCQRSSVKLFVNKFGYIRSELRPILVNPVNINRSFHISSNVQIFFPHDIDNILENHLSLGTWVAFPRGESFGSDGGQVPSSWAMLSVWNNFFHPFGFYFMYGVHQEGPLSGKLVRSLCQFVHNMAKNKSKDCKVIVTEVGGKDTLLRHHIPHWKLLSCPEDLWCIKALKSEESNSLQELTKTQQHELFL
ncbi:hypothetical protein RGQ29_000354 [Quercus rubra]|uniref:Uncharacterized protein n=1 Tax=Quercus rubra TaxID=3512 RepID=A0AAN7G5M1_QUERU|nr:hypothetical protein RGQ29_000354 [Quercus rubra]